MELPKPQYTGFTSLVNDIEKGKIKIPQFQRDFVWSKQKSAELMDSIFKGYPIGTFILWKTKERLRSIRNLGGVKLPEPPKGDFIEYILDGQQRLTSIYATLRGLGIIREDNVEEDFSEMYIDLLANEDDTIVITDIEEKDPESIIKLNDLVFGGIKQLSKLPEEHHDKLDDYKRRIESYSFSTILVEEAPIDVATEIFTRINVGGKPLSVFEIMVAKTYDTEREFDLSDEYDNLITRLEEVDFETISDSTVLQTVSVLLKKDCSKKVILKLDKSSFIDIWSNAVDAIERAVDYFRSYYRIPVSQLLPYNALIVPFAYFFYHHNDKPTGNKQRFLQDFFWRTSISERYSHSLEARLAQDVLRIDDILKDKQPKYDYSVDVSPEYINENGYFSAGRSYIKALLCLYSYYEPKSFIDHSLVQISNYWLKQANSKNYHHFFPKAFLRKHNIDDIRANHILNITIVDDYLNKREIGSKAPSKYMKKFEKNNPILDKTMKTHLISDVDKFGIWDNDYETFIKRRSEKISEELSKRLIY